MPTPTRYPSSWPTGRMTSSEDLRLALEAGATDYVRKPIDIIELRARINTAIRLREQQDAIKQLLQKEIELKNRKLSTTSMLLVEKNSMWLEFAREVDRLLSMFHSEDYGSLGEGIRGVEAQGSQPPEYRQWLGYL